MAAQGAFGTDFYERSTRTIVGTMLWAEYRPVIKIDPKGSLGSHEIRPIHSAPIKPRTEYGRSLRRRHRNRTSLRGTQVFTSKCGPSAMSSSPRSSSSFQGTMKSTRKKSQEGLTEPIAVLYQWVHFMNSILSGSD